MAGSVLAELERAELAARERRLAAATAGEARIAAASEVAAGIREDDRTRLTGEDAGA